MKRYKETRTDNVNGRGRVYKISLPDNFTGTQPIFTTYIPKDTERLDNIAYKFYKDSSKWYIIARANKSVTGKLYAQRGQTLIIPKQDL
jgi:hypothetical protein